MAAPLANLISPTALSSTSDAARSHCPMGLKTSSCVTSLRKVDPDADTAVGNPMSQRPGVEDVHPDVHQRTAAAQLRRVEGAVGRNPSAPRVAGAGKVDLAQVAGVDKPLHGLGLPDEAGLEIHGQDALGRVRSRHHRARGGEVQGHRLLGHHVASRPQRGNRRRRVGVRRGAHAHGVDLIDTEQLLVAVEDVRDIELRRQLLGAPDLDIGNGHDATAVGHAQVARNMPALGDRARPNDADAKLTRHTARSS